MGETAGIIPIAPLATAVCQVLGAVGADAASPDRIGVIDVERIITESAPGREGQKKLDAILAKYNDEFDVYVRIVDDPAKECERGILLSRALATEYTTIAGKLLDALWDTIENWLRSDGKEFSVIVSKGSPFASKTARDVSGEILPLFDKAEIDFDEDAQ